MDYFVHDTAVVDEGCKIGEGTRVWHFCHLMTGCIIGKQCTLGQNVMIASTVTIGNNVKVQNNVSLYDGVHCEDDVFIGPAAVFTNIINPRSAVVRKNEFQQTLIKKGATIGANATILCGIEIGTFAFIGAGTVVTESVPAYALYTGNPGRQSGWMSEQGYKLEFDVNGKAVCNVSGQQYQLTNEKVEKIN